MGMIGVSLEYAHPLRTFISSLSTQEPEKSWGEEDLPAYRCRVRVQWRWIGGHLCWTWERGNWTYYCVGEILYPLQHNFPQTNYASIKYVQWLHTLSIWTSNATLPHAVVHQSTPVVQVLMTMVVPQETVLAPPISHPPLWARRPLSRLLERGCSRGSSKLLMAYAFHLSEYTIHT